MKPTGREIQRFVRETTALPDTDDPKHPQPFSATALHIALVQAGWDEATQAQASWTLRQMWKSGYVRRSAQRVGPDKSYLYYFPRLDRSSEKPRGEE